ncbi:hypothetical protein DPMN_133141 [Dreissena polymorpha]|uniref:Uncharacterized protein n=1 Tax=Dreissena polymorpha TaxID=45954 RepID=A0A9D4FSZ0_DREPO|nr:hypothetical protein DPMN_133141 [Dreissena polymorpha]
MRDPATSTNFCSAAVSSAFSADGLCARAGSTFCFSDQDLSTVSKDCEEHTG